MRILHIIDSAGIYGAEVMLLNLMVEQVRIGLHPMLLSIEPESTENESDLVIEAKRRGLNTIRMELTKGYNRNDAHKIIECARLNKVDVIHSHGYKSNILLGFLSRKARTIPVISTAHGWISVRMFTRIWLYLLFDKLAMRRLDAVVYVNPLSKNEVRHKRPFFVENGIPIHDFADNGNMEEFFTRKENKEFIIGAILRLSEEKGLIYLLEAARQLILEKYNIKVAVIGDGPLRDVYESFISSHNLGERIQILGYRSSAYRYLKSFDLFVLPSLTEGLPITILEAMQSGTPIIATGVGAVPHVLDNGKFGEIVNRGDSLALSNAIKESINNYSRSSDMAEKAKRHVFEKYSCHQMAAKYLDIYKTVTIK